MINELDNTHNVSVLLLRRMMPHIATIEELTGYKFQEPEDRWQKIISFLPGLDPILGMQQVDMRSIAEKLQGAPAEKKLLLRDHIYKLSRYRREIVKYQVVANIDNINSLPFDDVVNEVLGVMLQMIIAALPIDCEINHE